MKENKFKEALPVIIVVGILLLFGFFVRKLYQRNQVVEIISQELVKREEVFVEEATPIDSNLTVNLGRRGMFDSRSFSKEDIGGDIEVQYTLSNNKVVTDRISVEDYYGHKMPGEKSLLIVNSYYTGKYKLKSGKLIDLNLGEKVSIGDNLTRYLNDYNYQYDYFFEKIVPYKKEIPVGVRVSWRVSNGKTSVTHYSEENFTLKND